MENHMTALVSCFARAYHFNHNSQWVFMDNFAGELLSEEECKNISSNMSAGIAYFNPDFKGTAQEALRFIVTAIYLRLFLEEAPFASKHLNSQ